AAAAANTNFPSTGATLRSERDWGLGTWDLGLGACVATVESVKTRPTPTPLAYGLNDFALPQDSLAGMASGLRAEAAMGHAPSDVSPHTHLARLYPRGSTTRPTNRMLPLALSRMK